MSKFPKALRTLRQRYFYKQLALANACDCSPAHISWLESGKRYPSCAMLHKLKVALLEARAAEREIAELLAEAQAEIIRQRFEGLE